jgi:hypothetical protein
MPRQNENINLPRRLVWLALMASPILLIVLYLLVMMVSFGGSEMTGMGQ